MYHAHFGLKRPLFDGGIARDQSVFRSAKHEQLVDRFKLALASPCSVITLTGQPGIGKTTLTSAALRASRTRLAIAWLPGLVANGAELLEVLLAELGLAEERTTRVERLQLWRQFHGEMDATESRVFVIAERADDLSVEVLRALDGLTAPDATGYTGANVILLGQAGLEQHLEAPALESLRQRIRLRARLEPFTEGELQDYLRHQAACAGGDFDRVFAPGTAAAVFRHTGGVARVANHLCETALAVAAEEGEKLLTATTVQRVATTILGLAGTEMPAAMAPAATTQAHVRATEPLPSSSAATTAAPANVPAAVAKPGAVAKDPPAVAPAASTSVAVAPPTPPVPLAAAAEIASTARAPLPAPAVQTAAASTPPLAKSVLAPAEAVLPEFEYDGEATEVPDVSFIDFPVLTDAIDEAAATPTPPASASNVTVSAASNASATPAARPETPPTVAPTPSVSTNALPTAATPVPAAAPPPRPAPAPAMTASNTAGPTPTGVSATRRVETAYTPSRPPTTPKPPPASAKPTPGPTPQPAGAKPAPTESKRPTPSPPSPPSPPRQDHDADDALRQTQTLRAIAEAKSIDEISSSMAETLFGEAELDILNAALAASIDEAPETAAPAPPPPRATPSSPPQGTRSAPPPARTETRAAPPSPRKQAVSTEDDLLDLLDLTSEATLELMDEPLETPAVGGRKSAGQR